MSRLVLALFLALTLAPIWLFEYLPLQDYPQHLYQAQIVRDVVLQGRTDTPYEVRLNPLYSSFYLCTALLGQVMPMDVAGRVMLSLYPVLLALAVWRLETFLRRPEDGPAWGAFATFALCFSPFYFLGFVNYLYALSLLTLTMLDLVSGMETGWTPLKVLRQVALVVLTLFAHPFSLVSYICIVTAWILVVPPYRKRLFLALGASGALFSLVYLAQKPSTYGQSAMKFLGPVANARFLLSPFTNYGWETPDLTMVALWLLALGLVAASAWKFGCASRRLALLGAAVMAGAVVAGLFAPWGIGGMNFALGLRLGGLLYLFGPWLLASVRMRGPLAALFLALMATILSQNVVLQSRISREIATIGPLVRQMEPDQTVVTILLDQGLSPEMDWYHFQPHNYDNFYYQLAKGGITPQMWSASFTPVIPKPGTTPPAPNPQLPFEFRWELHGGYRYYLVRGGTPEMQGYFLAGAREVARSGPWLLLERP